MAEHRELSPQEIDDLAKALTKVMDVEQLKRLVHLATGEDMFAAYVPPTLLLPLRGLTRHLLLELEKLPMTDLLLRQVYWEYPGQTKLRSAIAQLYPDIAGLRLPPSKLFSVQNGGVVVRAPDTAPPALQTIVNKALQHLPIRVWLDRIGQIERRVCRVEVGEDGIGTGFLVGPDVVLTNWHVVQKARDLGLADALDCRFDYSALPGGGVDPGLKVAVAAVLAESPASTSERKGLPDDPPPPAPDELDFALLRLATSQAARGHLALKPPPPLPIDSPLLIVQHPSGHPMDFTIDTQAVIGRAGQDRRLRYRTNTLPGSSGSPCFTMDLDLVALHHLGDGTVGAPFNQGVPIELVHAGIVAAGYGARLGG